MKAVITVIGRDQIGIVAKVTTRCAEEKMNILQIQQQILDGIFTMILITDLAEVDRDFSEVADDFAAYGRKENLDICMRHEDAFRVMNEVER